MVATTPPVNCQRSNGVFFDFDTSFAASIVDARSGAEDRDVGGRAFVERPPGRFSRRAGLTESSSIIRVSEIRPAWTSRSKHDRHRGLEADDAERRAIELDHLLVDVVRRMVRGDHVHAAVGDALEHRVAILRRAQWRVHLEVRVVLHRAVQRSSVSVK